MLIPIAGIDVGKFFSELVILSPVNAIYTRFKINHNSNSLSHSIELLRKAEKEFKVKPAIIMEATGHYHKILFNFFKNFGYDVIVVNPIQSNSIKNLSIRKVKSDKIDAYRIALLYRFSELKQTNIPAEDVEILRSLCRQYHCLVDERSTYKTRMLSILDQIMLNYSEVFSKVYGETSLSLLEIYSTPNDILSANPDELILLIANSSRKSIKWATAKYQLLCKKASEFKDISISSAANVTMLKNYIQIIRTFNQAILNMQKSIEDMILSKSLNPIVAKQAVLIMSIPGIGLITSATIIGEIGSISAFKNSSKLTAFFGIDPSVHQSGQFNSTRNHISKRGSIYLRKVLYMVVVANISTHKGNNPVNPYLYEFYKQKCISKPKKVAFVAAMHKIILYIYAVLRNQSPFVLRSPEDHVKLLTEKTLPKSA